MENFKEFMCMNKIIQEHIPVSKSVSDMIEKMLAEHSISYNLSPNKNCKIISNFSNTTPSKNIFVYHVSQDTGIRHAEYPYAVLMIFYIAVSKMILQDRKVDKDKIKIALENYIASNTLWFAMENRAEGAKEINALLLDLGIYYNSDLSGDAIDFFSVANTIDQSGCISCPASVFSKFISNPLLTIAVMKSLIGNCSDDERNRMRFHLTNLQIVKAVLDTYAFI